MQTDNQVKPEVRTECDSTGSSPARCSGVAPVAIKDRLKWLRETKRMTRTEAAKLLGVSLSLVSLWEDGKRTIGADHAMKMARAFGVSLDWMLNATILPNIHWPEVKPKQRKKGNV